MPNTPLTITAALGDACGATTEFMSPTEAKAAYPETLRLIGKGPFDLTPGSCTDDTQMSLCLWAAARETKDILQLGEQCIDSFSHWLQADPKDAGLLTQKALRSSAAKAWEESGFNAASNGSLMRNHALIDAGQRGESLLQAAAIQSASTHLDPRCVLACCFQAKVAELLSEHQTNDPENIIEIINQATSSLRWGTGATELLIESKMLPAVLRKRWSKQAREAQENLLLAIKEHSHVSAQSGYVVHTLTRALWSLGQESLETAILKITRQGDDSDTTATVSSALWGARGASSALCQQLTTGLEWTWRDYRFGGKLIETVEQL